MTDTNQTSPEDVTTTNPPETVTETTVQSDEANIDFKTKFSESSREALRLLDENRKKDAEIERLRVLAESSKENGTSYGNNSEALYPGFENLSEDEQKNLVSYTNTITQKAVENVYKDPAIAFAKQSYNEKTWDNAFDTVAGELPELRDTKEEFKQKYFRADNVPSNIKDILKDLAKSHLYDRAKDIGAKQAAEQASRIDIERAKGGDKTPAASRSLEDWNRLAQSNPAEFAKNAKQFNEELASGKLK